MLIDSNATLAAPRAVLLRLCLAALATLAVSAAIGPRGCSCTAGVSQRPSLVWDGTKYTVAWGSPDDGEVDVYVHRFDLGSGTAIAQASEPERAIRVDSLRSTPELAAGPDGFLLLVHRGDRDLLALRLDRDSRVRGEPRRAARDTATLCAAPGWAGDGQYAAAWVAREPGDGLRLVLAFLDSSGAIARQSGIAVPDGGSCALAVGERAVALVYTAPAASAVTIASRTGIVDADLTALTGRGARVLRLVAIETGFAILLTRPDGGLRVAELDRRGRAVRAYDLAGTVDRDSADLGASRQGLFVTWTDARRAWLAGLASDGQLTARWYARGGRQLSATRALGRERECATAWTSLGGLMVHAAVAPDCPRP